MSDPLYAEFGKAGPPQRPALPRWAVERLCAGGREAVIEHAGEDYRLRITAKGKLILTK